MPGVDFNRLRNEITMREVLERLGWKPTNLADGRYYCHKCHSKGNQLELWAAIHNQSIYQAAVDLCQALGKDMPWIKRW
jgi:hypothetical protein